MSTSDTLARFIRYIMRDITYYKHYTCVVALQAGDKVDLIPSDDAIKGAGLSGVPIEYNVPGLKFTIAPGTEMTLFFENGDPKKPKARFAGGSHIELKYNDGVMPFARVGDQIVITSATSVSGGAVTGTGIISAGSPTVKG